MNVLKRSYEGARAAVWAYLDPVKDVCEGARAVVLGASDQRQMLCHVAARVWVQPKRWERLYTEALRRTIDIGGEFDAVAHGNHDILFDHHIHV